MKKVLLVVGLLLSVAANKAGATVAIGSGTGTGFTNTSGLVLISTPTSGKLFIKACLLSNDASSATCVDFRDGTTRKFTLCAGAQANVNTPVHTSLLPGAMNGGFDDYLGESLNITNAFTVKGGTASASVNVTCTYDNTRAD